MAENALVARRKTKADIANPLLAKRSRNPNSIARELEAAGGQREPDADPSEIERARLMQEFNKLPWYQQAGQAADDLVRVGASGASYGGLDRLLGEDEQEKTRLARLRAGAPGTIAEIGGMVASPVTRAVGAGAQALKPAGQGLMKALAKLGITGAEGASLAGLEAAVSGEGDVGEQALLGGGIASGAEATFKHAIPKPLGLLASLMSRTPYKALSDTHKIASESALGSKAISDVRSNRPPVALIEAIDKTRAKLEGKPAKDIGQVEEALLDVFNRTTTSSGHKALDSSDKVMIDRLINSAYDTKIDATKFNRSNLDDLAAYLENTKIPVAAEKSVGGMHVKNVHEAVRKAGAETDPAFNDLVEMLKTKGAAYSAGHATKDWLPQIGVFDKAKDAAIVASLVGGGALVSPMLAAALAPVALLASPRTVGKTAQMSGAAKRKLKKATKALTGSDLTYGKLGLAPAVQERLEQRER